MRGRTGPFWDGVEGRAPLPWDGGAAVLRIHRRRCRCGTIELVFAATEAFTNPSGNVLGAFKAAMRFDTVGPALLATLAPDLLQSALQLNVTSCGRSGPAGSSPGAGLSTATGIWCSWGGTFRRRRGGRRHRHRDRPSGPAAPRLSRGVTG